MKVVYFVATLLVLSACSNTITPEPPEGGMLIPFKEIERQNLPEEINPNDVNSLSIFTSLEDEERVIIVLRRTGGANCIFDQGVSSVWVDKETDDIELVSNPVECRDSREDIIVYSFDFVEVNASDLTEGIIDMYLHEDV